MKNLLHKLITIFLIMIPAIVLANNDGPFSYTTSGSIPSITAVGDAYSITYTITSQLTLSKAFAVSFTPSSSAFTLTNNCKSPLVAGGSCSLVVNFKPKQLGAQSATLNVDYDVFKHIINTTIKSTVNNVVVTGKVLTALPKSTAVNTDYPVAIEFTNTSTNFPATNITIEKQFPTDFQVDTSKSTCLASTSLAPQASCDIIGDFKPTQVGAASISAKFSYQEGDAINVQTKTTVNNVVVTGKVVTALPKFTAVDTAYPVVMEFTNTSPNLYATNVTIEKQFPVDFQVDTSKSTCLTSTSLAPQASCNIVGDFKPTQAGAASISAKFSYQQGSVVNLQTETAVEKLVINAELLQKLPGITKANRSYPINLHFTNESHNLAATISSVTHSYPTSGFTLKTDDCSKLTSLAPGQSCDLIGIYQPTSLLGNQTVKMQINYTGGQPVIAQTSTYTGVKLYMLQGLGQAQVCDVNVKDGTLNDCHSFLPSIRSLFSTNLVINPQATYTYQSGLFKGITVCQLNQNAVPSNCKKTATQFSSPQGIAFDGTGKYIYIGTLDTGSNTLPMCQVDSDGTLSHCKAVGTAFDQPENIVINPVKPFLYATNGATNGADNDPTVCQMAKDGTLSNCKPAFNNYSNHRERMMAINPAGTRAYITTASLNEVDVFSINKDGTLSDRKATGNDISSPKDIVINPTGTFAYINNNGNLLICKINAEDGTLTDCKNQTTFKNIGGLSIY